MREKQGWGEDHREVAQQPGWHTRVGGSTARVHPARSLGCLLPTLLNAPAPHPCSAAVLLSFAQYRMLEYCYAANGLAFFHLFFRPQSAFLRRVSSVWRR